MNPYELAKREEKAGKIARTLRDADATPAAAAALNGPQRRTLEQAARVNPSSDETWALAIEKLARMTEDADVGDLWGDLDRSHRGLQRPSEGR